MPQRPPRQRLSSNALVSTGKFPLGRQPLPNRITSELPVNRPRAYFCASFFRSSNQCGTTLIWFSVPGTSAWRTATRRPSGATV
jgi:hypothetical protein